MSNKLSTRLCVVPLSIVLAVGCVSVQTLQAQTSIQSYSPRTLPPNQATRVTITGVGLDGNLRLSTTDPTVLARVVTASTTTAEIELTTTDQTPLGPVGLLASADAGIVPPAVFIVDDLPAIKDAGNNHDQETAQVITNLTAIEGIIENTNGDFYKLELVAGERIAIEVQTQGLGSAMDPVIRILDGDGNVLHQFDDDAIGPEVRTQYTSPIAQTVLLEVFDSRHAVGGIYHLRVGDFPIGGLPMPLAVEAGKMTSVKFSGEGDNAKPININISPEKPISRTSVAMRFDDGKSSIWRPLLVRAAPQYTESIEHVSGDAMQPPLGISGLLAQSGEVDTYVIEASAGMSVRFESQTRTLGCATLLRMQLFHPNGNKVAETAVSAQDEWSFDFAFPEAGKYHLRVDDLLGRGGPKFGYHIDMIPAGSFQIAFKPDPATAEEFVVEQGNGAAAIDLQMTRFGFDGPVRVAFATPVEGLELIESVIPAAATDARVYLKTTASWTPQSLSAIRLIAMPVVGAEAKVPNAIVDGFALQRIKQPHLLMPNNWQAGLIRVAGVAASEPFFAIRSDRSLFLSEGVAAHTFQLSLTRLQPEFKGEVRLSGPDLPAGWSIESKIEGDVVSATVKFDPQNNSKPDSIRLHAFGQHGARARLETFDIPIQWIEDVEVYPREIALATGKERRQIIVTELKDSQAEKDRTRDAKIVSSDPAIIQVVGTAVFPKANGNAEIVVELGAVRKTIPVVVSGMEQASRVDFESEVLVALSKQGCNAGACHGSPSGKGMFRMSLRAFDAKLDELTLIREEMGRRLNLIEPEKSLLLSKPLMEVAHGGGRQMRKEDEAYSILHDWIAEGARPDPPNTARCIRLEVLPSEKRVQKRLGGGQQIAAIAHFSDGSSRDVTHLVAYESSNNQVAKVDEQGYVTAEGRGDAAILVRFLEHIESVPLMFIDDIEGFEWDAPTPINYIDEFVQAKLRQLQYLPSSTCSDSDFVRRVYLDVIGTLPTIEETKVFLADPSPVKRANLIDSLLERDEFAKFWALKWGDYLKMTKTLVGDQGIYKYYRWVENSIRENMPYDVFVRELLTASGSTLSNPAANFYRTTTDMNDRVETVSQVFLGARLQCAKCHNHPFERWTQDNYYGLGAFFNRVQTRTTQRNGETFVYSLTAGEVTQPRTGQQVKPWLPRQGSSDAELPGDRRDDFANWLTASDNPFLARVEANRIWSHLFSRGIVDPIDDFRDSNPPSNEPLLDALAADFVAHGFDRKHLLRTILNSQAYQAGYKTNDFNKSDTQYFSHQLPRLLGAEQLHDAVYDSLGLAASFSGLPAGMKATRLPAPDIAKIAFLKVFGQPERATVCDCERVDDSNLGMAIELLNGSTIHSKLQDVNNRFRTGLASGKDFDSLFEELYLAALCRLPTSEENEAAIAYRVAKNDDAAALEDLYWAMFNLDEFLFQH